ncbi:MAG: hypothetical protein QM682_06375 [Paracoccus sp. (in: a-proteobacteria)]|uniref:hypothetical protein n=1 Tax=Paracoccus sp. TaxID=267 RepID=UPI0039E59909
MTDFFDQLTAICSPELFDAIKHKDRDRLAAMIEGLATMLGRTVARATAGDAVEIEKMLAACEHHAAAEAAGIINLAETLRGRQG